MQVQYLVTSHEDPTVRYLPDNDHWWGLAIWHCMGQVEERMDWAADTRLQSIPREPGGFLQTVDLSLLYAAKLEDRVRIARYLRHVLPQTMPNARAICMNEELWRSYLRELQSKGIGQVQLKALGPKL